MGYVEKKEYLWLTKDGSKPLNELTKEQLIEAVIELIRRIENPKDYFSVDALRRQEQLQGFLKG